MSFSIILFNFVIQFISFPVVISPSNTDLWVQFNFDYGGGLLFTKSYSFSNVNLVDSDLF